MKKKKSLVPTLAATTNRSRNIRRLCSLMVVALMLVCLTMVAFADDPGVSTIGEAVGKGAHSVYITVCTVASALAALALAIRGALLIAGGQKAMEVFKQEAGHLVIALIVIWCAPLIVSTLKDWFGSLGGNAESEIFGAVPSAGH